MMMTEPEFRDLLDKYLSGRASPEESNLLQQFFDAYRDEHPDISGIRADIKGDIKERILTELRGKKGTVIEIVPERQRSVWLRAAAVILIILGSYILFSRYTQQDPTTEQLAVKTVEHKTTRGQRLNIVLPDGTHLKLNSNSAISYPETFQGATRDVTLLGEGYFDVVHDSTKPFIVHTGATSTKVLGTSFNVNADQGAVTVTLVTGKVNVSNLTSDAILSPNQQAVMRTGSEDINTKNVDASHYTAWTNNRLIFENTSLSEAFMLLENWYNVDITMGSNAIKNCVITGKYENESLENVLNSFGFMLKMKYTIKNRKVTVTGPGCN